MAIAAGSSLFRDLREPEMGTSTCSNATVPDVWMRIRRCFAVGLGLSSEFPVMVTPLDMPNLYQR